MKQLFLLLLSAGFLLSSLQAEDNVKYPSPDGKFAMLSTRAEEGTIAIQLIEVSSRKAVLDLADTGNPYAMDCTMLWSPDSQRVAFFNSSRRGGTTTVYFRNESGFEEIPLPELPGCREKAAAKDDDEIVKGLGTTTSPQRWDKSGALVLTVADAWVTARTDVRECSQTITVAFNPRKKASIQKVTRKKK